MAATLTSVPPPPDRYDLVQLANGSFSLRSARLGETFHPVIGPAAEAEALYVRQLGLAQRFAQSTGPFVVWDVGLGAAANVLTVLKALSAGIGQVEIVSFDHDLDPLRAGFLHRDSLGYFGGFESAVETLLRDGVAQFAVGGIQVVWKLWLGDFPTLLASPSAAAWPKPSVILFDAFSPARNPNMWSLPLFTQLYRALDPAHPCAMPTYSRSTLLRVTLLLAGFFVGAGEATGEKEETTIAANTLDLVSAPLDAQWLKRVKNSTSAEPLAGGSYVQRPLSPGNWLRLLAHPQFASVAGEAFA